MKEQIVNILIIDDDDNDLNYLYDILQSPGNNIFKAKCKQNSIDLIKQKKIAIVLCSVDTKDINFFKFVDSITSNKENKDIFVIATATKKENVYKLVKGLKKGAVDYLLKPYIPNLVKAKVDTYKRIYLKNKRISNLLENILPLDTLNEFEQYGKSSPKKHTNCTILFTDFVKFSQKARQLKPKELIEKLDFYFTKFDEIILKYKLEKIKTIGDAYMAVGGVTKKHNIIEINTALAALEIQSFINTEIETQKALGNDYWEIRIGLHSGDLIAGVIGKHKFSFDVWGDSVNVAARCEQTSLANHINISEDFYKKIYPFFETSSRGSVKVKNRGEIEMHFLNRIKPEFSFDKRGLNANYKLRTLANLSTEDFDRLRMDIINQLKIELDDNLFYHSIEHTLNVEQAAKKYAQLEGLTPKETMLLCTAALFHDSGFIIAYDDNEEIGARIFKQMATKYGYSPMDIQTVTQMILATNNKVEPVTLSEKILCDADHDYLGRLDYHHIAEKLRKELAVFKKEMTDKDWLDLQINYLENKHKYHTISAINLRQYGKLRRITELKDKLKDLH